MPSKTVHELPIQSIRVGKRHRKDLGDLTKLIESISETGLLQPVVVTPSHKLIAGFRRLSVCKKLGWKTVPVRVVDLEKVVEGEFAENVHRKDFTLSEVASIAKRLRPILQKRAHERRVSGLKKGNEKPVGTILPNGEGGKTRDAIARAVGVSGMTLQKVLEVVEAAEEDPKRFGLFKERMDASGKVNKHWQQLRVARLMQTKASKKVPPNVGPDTMICGDCLEVLPKFPRNTFDAVIFDPPWGVNFTYDAGRERNADPGGYWNWFEPIYKQTMRVLKPGGFWACWQSHNYLRYCWDWFGSDIRIFAACKDKVQMRAGRAYGWEPIIFKWKPGPRQIYPYGGKKPMDFYVCDWGSHLRDKLAGKHPCPRPLDLVRAIIENYTMPGALILDPTSGSGTTCIAAASLKPRRHYIGIEIHPAYVALAEERLRAELG